MVTIGIGSGSCTCVSWGPSISLLSDMLISLEFVLEVADVGRPVVPGEIKITSENLVGPWKGWSMYLRMRFC